MSVALLPAPPARLSPAPTRTSAGTQRRDFLLRALRHTAFSDCMNTHKDVVVLNNCGTSFPARSAGSHGLMKIGDA